MRNEKGLALWAKIALVIAGIGTVCVLAIVIAGIIFIGPILDHDKIRAIESKFMTIENPLRNGLHYYHGYEISSIPVIEIFGRDNNLLYTITTRGEGTFSEPDARPEAMIETCAKGEMPGLFGIASDRKIVVTKQSSIIVGGQKMPYVIGHVESPIPMGGDKTMDNMFVGAVHSQKLNRLIIIWGGRDYVGLPIKPVTEADIKNLTDSITGW